MRTLAQMYIDQATEFNTPIEDRATLDENCDYVRTFVSPKFGYNNDALWGEVDAIAARFGGLNAMWAIKLRNGSFPGDEAVMAAFAYEVHEARCKHSPFNSVGAERVH